MKRVYDPTEDRKQRKPDHIDAILTKIKNGEVKIKGQNNPKAKPKTAEPKAEETKPVTEPTQKDLEGFLAVLKRLGKPSSSREISDALGIKDADKGRALVRRVMEKLIADGKVVAVESEKKNIGKLYKLP